MIIFLLTMAGYISLLDEFLKIQGQPHVSIEHFVDGPYLLPNGIYTGCVFSDLITICPIAIKTTNSFKTLKTHGVYRIRMFMYGYRIARVTRKNVFKGNVEDILQCIYIAHIKGLFDTLYLYLMMCYLLYECLPFEEFSQEFATQRFYTIEHKSIINELQEYKRIDMINLILRCKTHSFRVFYAQLDKSYRDNISITFSMYTYEAYGTELSKTVQVYTNMPTTRHDVLMEEAYSIIATRTLKVFKYASVMRGINHYLNTREINIAQLHKYMCTDTLTQFGIRNMYVIHIANMKHRVMMSFPKKTELY